jgi:hypothetical protein
VLQAVAPEQQPSPFPPHAWQTFVPALQALSVWQTLPLQQAAVFAPQVFVQTRVPC